MNLIDEIKNEMVDEETIHLKNTVESMLSGFESKLKWSIKGELRKNPTSNSLRRYYGCDYDGDYDFREEKSWLTWYISDYQYLKHCIEEKIHSLGFKDFSVKIWHEPRYEEVFTGNWKIFSNEMKTKKRYSGEDYFVFIELKWQQLF